MTLLSFLVISLTTISCKSNDSDYISMSQSHFISVADSCFDVIEPLKKYSVQYDMTVENTNAAFLLGDSYGEYGELLVVQIDTVPDENNEGGFYINYMNGGRNKEQDKLASFPIADDCKYTIELSVDATSLSAKINGNDIGVFQTPEIALGCIGTYKGRSVSLGYLDNVVVKSEEGREVFKEDFEEDTNIFAPYYTYIEDGRLRISSGVLTTACNVSSAPVFRREFSLSKNPRKIESAVINMTALGAFDMSLNGQKVNDDYLSPGKLLFNQYLEYVSYDVTDLLKKDNTWDITLCHGFYDRGVGFPEIFSPWGNQRALKGELVIKYSNGEIEVIPTDAAFKASTEGPVVLDDIYQGEFFDATKSVENTSNWQSVKVDSVDEMYLNMDISPKTNQPIKSILSLSPVSMTEPVPNTYVYDFGQNISGTVKLDMQKINLSDLGLSSGDVITLRYGETLNAEGMSNTDGAIGTIWTLNLLTAKATDYLVVGDYLPKELEFSHTCHGFRYLQIMGTEAPIPTEAVCANVITTALPVTGSFTCSNDAINRLFENARFSVYSNFLDSPSDCNQRDERLGWTGDAQAVSLFANYLLDTKDFYNKYLRDIRLVQSDEGAFPDMAPRNIETDKYGVGGAGGNNCWGDAGVVITWNTYLKYGEKSILEDNFDACKKWVDYLVSHSDQYIRSGENSYGDHLSAQDTPADLSDTAWSAHSADLVSKMARALGNTADEEKYKEIFESYRKAWNDKYIRPDADASCGILYDESQTGYALGLCFDLFDEEMKPQAAERLNILSEYSGYMFAAGYSGVNYLLPALADNGYSQSAMNILTNANPGNIMYPLSMGMTTMPEMLSCFVDNGDGTYWINGSLNHYAYASVCAYCFSEILGLTPEEDNPGYKHFRIAPKMGGGLTSASGSYECPYGTISISWESNDNGESGHLTCTIPADCGCTVIIPDGVEYEMTEGTKEFTW